jgi:hypothetical protein
MKVLIVQVPKAADLRGFPIQASIDISIRGAFRKVSSGAADVLTRLAGTDIYNRFFTPFSDIGLGWPRVLGDEPGAAMRGGAGGDDNTKLEAEVLQDFVREVIGHTQMVSAVKRERYEYENEDKDDDDEDMD